MLTIILLVFCFSRSARYTARQGYNFPHSGAMHKFAHRRIFKLM